MKTMMRGVTVTIAIRPRILGRGVPAKAQRVQRAPVGALPPRAKAARQAKEEKGNQEVRRREVVRGPRVLVAALGPGAQLHGPPVGGEEAMRSPRMFAQQGTLHQTTLGCLWASCLDALQL